MTAIVELLLPLVWALVFLAAGLQSQFADDSIALPGLRHLAGSGDGATALQVGAVVLAAGWIMIRRWQTRDRLLVFLGLSIALMIQGFVHVGMPFGLAFACFAGIAKRRADEQKPGEQKRR